jgi:hypothetical protein
MKVQAMDAVRMPRVVSAGIAAGLFAATVAVGMREDASGWLALGFAVMPDLSMLAGIGQPIEKGRMAPRAVPFYNALHSLLGPVALLAAVLAFGWSASWIGAALAWATHIMVDRAVGYGMRTPEGHQRAVSR